MNRALGAVLLWILFASAAFALTPPLAEQKITPTPGDMYETVLRMLDYFPGYLIFTVLLPALGLLFHRRFLAVSLFASLLAADLFVLVFLSGVFSLNLAAMDGYMHPQAILLFLLLVRPSFVAVLGFLVSEVFRRFRKTRNIQARLARHRPLPVFLGFLCAAVLSNLVLLLFKYNRAAYSAAKGIVLGWSVVVGLLLIGWLVYLYKSAKTRPEKKPAHKMTDWLWPAGMSALCAILLGIIYS